MRQLVTQAAVGRVVETVDAFVRVFAQVVQLARAILRSMKPAVLLPAA